MFKIVQTLEKGLKQLTIVPGGWVENNQLSWPKMGADKLIKNPNSLPESNWFTMQCKLKRNHLISYEIAEEELERMLENDDTEQEETTEIIQTKKRPRMIFPKNKSDAQNDFNRLADECLMDTPMQKGDKSLGGLPNNEIILSSNVVNTEPSISYQNYQLLPPNNDAIQYSSLFDTSATTEVISQKIDTIIANQEILMQRQQVIIDTFQHSACPENQLKIMQQLAKLEVMLDSLASKSANNACSCKNSSLLETIKDDIFFDLIDTSSELQEFEGKLADQSNMDEYVRKFSYVCGRKGSSSGITNCYILVDKLFSRKLFTLCSWAGGARDGKEKIPFKIFKNVINLFFRVVRLSDDTFTLKDCEAFFKGIIRNSTKRNESSLTRSSGKKRRPSSLSYKAREEKLLTAEETKEENMGRNSQEVDNKSKNTAREEKLLTEEETIEENMGRNSQEVENKSNNTSIAEENDDTDEKDEETQ